MPRKSSSILRKILKEKFNSVIKSLKNQYPNDIELIKEIEDDYKNFPNIEQPSFINDNSEIFIKSKELFTKKFDNLECNSSEFKEIFGTLNFKQAYRTNYFDNKEYRCCFCGQLLELTEKDGNKYVHCAIEHILPKSKFPQFALHPNNLVPICNECNSGEKGARFFDNFSEFKHALDQLNISLFDRPFKLWDKYNYSFDRISDIKIKNSKTSEGYKLLDFYGIPKRNSILINKCYKILFSFIKHSDIHSPESLERLLENIASSNWHEVNDGYSFNNSPQIWQEFIEYILYDESNLLALWEELKDYSNYVNNYYLTI